MNHLVPSEYKSLAFMPRYYEPKTLGKCQPKENEYSC